jgi:predicted nucleic acid-binding protein
VSGGFLLDTNVPSEFGNPSPERRVTAWVASKENLHLSVVSIGELRKGFCLLPQSKRRTQLEQWFDHFLLPLVANRILPVTQEIGDRWGRLSAERQSRGTPLAVADGLIAATALEHDLTLVTRNVKDYSHLGVPILNPWDDLQ